jgi:soluble lytic murein transglycosylase-like protein
MQLMDSTAQRIGVTRIFHPRDNILGGVKYLSDMLKEFNGNEELALASYNAGPAAVKKYGGIPPYRETREYVQRVLALRETFKNQAVSVAAAPVTQGE